MAHLRKIGYTHNRFAKLKMPEFRLSDEIWQHSKHTLTKSGYDTPIDVNTGIF